MLSHCLECRKNSETKTPKVVRTKNGTTMPLWKCSVCNSKKLKFFKEQKARGLLSKWTRVKIPILSNFFKLNTFFWKHKRMQ